MMFVLTWTTGGDASNLSGQSLCHQVHFVCSSMSSGIVKQSMFNSVVKCGITDTAAMEQPPWNFGFMPLPFIALYTYFI
jgi:hypothetical protein